MAQISAFVHTLIFIHEHLVVLVLYSISCLLNRHSHCKPRYTAGHTLWIFLVCTAILVINRAWWFYLYQFSPTVPTHQTRRMSQVSRIISYINFWQKFQWTPWVGSVYKMCHYHAPLIKHHETTKSGDLCDRLPVPGWWSCDCTNNQMTIKGQILSSKPSRPTFWGSTGWHAGDRNRTVFMWLVMTADWSISTKYDDIYMLINSMRARSISCTSTT